MGIFWWLLPQKGDAEEISNKYFIEITNCSRISSDTDRELKELFKATDYIRSEGGQSFLTPIVRVTDTTGKKVSFGIPIYDVNYWRYKWANPDLYLYAERVEDQEKFWKQMNTEENFEKVKTILTRSNVVLNSPRSTSYIIDYTLQVEVIDKTYNSFTSFRKAIDKKIRSGEIKPGEALPVYVVCFKNLVIDTPPPPKVDSTEIISKTKKTEVSSGFRRIDESNRFTWNKKLTEIAGQLIIEMELNGNVIVHTDVTSMTSYCFSPGNDVKGNGVNVYLKVLDYDRNEFYITGLKPINIVNPSCSCDN